jgi:hypothetical protein
LSYRPDSAWSQIERAGGVRTGEGGPRPGPRSLRRSDAKARPEPERIRERYTKDAEETAPKADVVPADDSLLLLTRHPEPSTRVLNEPTCYHFRVLDPRRPLRTLFSEQAGDQRDDAARR